MTYYHGTKKDSAYFEGWYLKHQQGNDTIALIPAVHMDGKGDTSASIQVVTQQGAHAFRFPLSAFSAQENTFDVSIGNNHFTHEGLSLSLSGPSLTVTGSLQYGPLCPLSWDIMGPFALLPFLQCNHGVISMGHTVRGKLLINGKPMAFTRGVGYPMEEVAKMSSLNAARLLGMERERGSIRVGKYGDFTILTDDYEVLYTISEGVVVYDAQRDDACLNPELLKLKRR